MRQINCQRTGYDSTTNTPAKKIKNYEKQNTPGIKQKEFWEEGECKRHNKLLPC